MPNYSDLRPEADFEERDYEVIFPRWKDNVQKSRTIENLLVLREGLRNKVAAKRADRNLLIASWNIKEFGHTKQRLPEAYFYIAEILSSFDLIAIQEIKSSLKDLNTLMQLLGKDWGFIINDMTEGKDGNFERSAYILNRKRVDFAGLAGEIVLWDDLTKDSPIKQLKRTPYITGFTSGWKTFAIVNLHLHPGSGEEDIQLRKEEVRLLLTAIHEKTSRGHFWNDNLILSGDFNLYAGDDKDNPTIEMINTMGFEEVESLKGVDTNASKTESFDRLFLTSNKYFTIAKDEKGVDVGGVFDPYEIVFKEGQEEQYRTFMLDQYTGDKDTNEPDFLPKYFKHPWRKNQLSDHFPIWFELLIDSSDEFLQGKLTSFKP
jgi:endonuclease/exonuclease/phosphatase family metal-dependent hydrolase